MQFFFHPHIAGLFLGAFLGASALQAETNVAAPTTLPEEVAITNTVDASSGGVTETLAREVAEMAEGSGLELDAALLEDAALELAPEQEESPGGVEERKGSEETETPVPADPVPAPAPAAPTVQLVPVMDPALKEELQALALRMAWVERSMGAQQDQALKGVMDANRTAIIIAVSFGAVGFLALVVAAFILSRAFQRFSDAALALPTLHQLGPGARMTALEEGEGGKGSAGVPSPFEQSNLRLVSALEQLENKIQKLESLPHYEGSTSGVTSTGNWEASEAVSSTVSPAEAKSNGGNGKAPVTGGRKELEDDRAVAIQALLDKGDALLNDDQAEEALECFEQIVVLNPDNTEALIRRGMALERLERMEAAVESYDEAIAANESLTLAYLHKGAVCNRLQRHREALECYEKALQTEHKS